MSAEPMVAPAPPDLWSAWRAFTEISPLPLATVEGPSHIVRDVNPAFCRLVAKPREEFVGQPFVERMPADDECLLILDRVYHTGKSASHTERDYPKSHPVLLSYTMWPVLADERPVGVMIHVTLTAKLDDQTIAMNEALVLGSVRQHEITAASEKLNAQLTEEISERKHAEEDLRRTRAQLADRAGQLEELVAERTAELTATNQQLEAFVYSIAHDLRAPLRSMQGFSALLLEDPGTALSETGRDFARRIDKSAQFMDEMLGDLLIFSRISQQQVELTAVSLDTVVESVLSRLQKDVQEKHARVENSGPWPAVLAHAPTLTQVVSNLMSNALKFVPPGVEPLVRLRTEERAEFVRVWVEDNGLGIASEHHGQIFRLFNRLHGEKYPGTGLGLVIVQKGVERMSGRVGVESTPGAGSRFWFELRKA